MIKPLDQPSLRRQPTVMTRNRERQRLQAHIGRQRSAGRRMSRRRQRPPLTCGDQILAERGVGLAQVMPQTSQARPRPCTKPPGEPFCQDPNRRQMIDKLMPLAITVRCMRNKRRHSVVPARHPLVPTALRMLRRLSVPHHSRPSRYSPYFVLSATAAMISGLSPAPEQRADICGSTCALAYRLGPPPNPSAGGRAPWTRRPRCSAALRSADLRRWA